MSLKYSFNRQEDSDLLEKAVSKVLNMGLRTKDISDGSKYISTNEMGKSIIKELNNISEG